MPTYLISQNFDQRIPRNSSGPHSSLKHARKQTALTDAQVPQNKQGILNVTSCLRVLNKQVVPQKPRPPSFA